MMEHEKMEKSETKMCGDMWCKSKNAYTGGGCGGGAYGLTIVGAAIYYIQNADTFWMGVLGVLKAIVWPAVLIHKVFGLLHM